MILLIGSMGSMGVRYSYILDYLGLDYRSFDIRSHPEEALDQWAKEADKFIIATPTKTHYDIILKLHKYSRPILCEKPVTKTREELLKLLDLKPQLTMVNQYLFMPLEVTDYGGSYYNYFRHGADGLAWDCLNIIGLSKQGTWIAGESPTWECQINGRKLALSDMDKAYIYMLSHWNEHGGENLEYIRLSHNKILNGEYNT